MCVWYYYILAFWICIADILDGGQGHKAIFSRQSLTHYSFNRNQQLLTHHHWLFWELHSPRQEMTSMALNKGKSTSKDSSGDEPAPSFQSSQLDICLQAMKRAYEANINSMNQRMDKMIRVHASGMPELRVSYGSKIKELTNLLDYAHTEIINIKSELTRLKAESQIPSIESAGTRGNPQVSARGSKI